ncbi:ribosomal protein S30-domain-containing protein [Sordaria sp. MPI-SDFR-AT-0083]|nr:ribosomal protein S30-domain-containing protein [Sordaria sp. MPI-SDFR-AT-0083]
MGKVHGSLARAGKVKSQTPKVEAQEKPKTPKGRAHKREIYTRRFVNVVNRPRRQAQGRDRSYIYSVTGVFADISSDLDERQPHCLKN